MPTYNISIQEIFFYGFIAQFAVFLLRYALVCGGAVLLIKLNEKRLQKRKIQPQKASWLEMKNEIKWSLSTFVIFGCNGSLMFYFINQGYTQMYPDIAARGWGYFWLSVMAAVLIHDTYFYWAHRLMHHKLLFKRVHLVHHQSKNPTPWASFSFHPTEAFLEVLILPLVLFTLPISPWALFTFLNYMVVMNVWGHLGYELLPRSFPRTFPWSLSLTSTHHNMHHSKNNCNYGFYFSVWDRLCGTMYKDYLGYYDQVKDRLDEPERVANDEVA